MNNRNLFSPSSGDWKGGFYSWLIDSHLLAVSLCQGLGGWGREYVTLGVGALTYESWEDTVQFIALFCVSFSVISELYRSSTKSSQLT